VKVAAETAAQAALDKVDPLVDLAADSGNVLLAVKDDFKKETIETIMKWFVKK